MSEKTKNDKVLKIEKERLFKLYIEKYISETQYYKIRERIRGNGDKRS